MQQSEKTFNQGYVFCAGSFRCVYTVEKTEREVVLCGEERDGESLAFRARLAFSPEQELQVQKFVRQLAESETFPRMMIELAEEYFSSAVLAY